MIIEMYSLIKTVCINSYITEVIITNLDQMKSLKYAVINS